MTDFLAEGAGSHGGQGEYQFAPELLAPSVSFPEQVGLRISRHATHSLSAWWKARPAHLYPPIGRREVVPSAWVIVGQQGRGGLDSSLREKGCPVHLGG